MSSWQGRESNLRFGWYLNLTKDEKNKTGNWRKTTKTNKVDLQPHPFHSGIVSSASKFPFPI